VTHEGSGNLLENVKGKILVTGGAGDIGSRLVRELLRRGCRVKVLDIRLGPFEKESDPNLEFVGVEGDSSEGGMADKHIVRQAMKDVDVVYHLAINWNGHTWKHTAPTADLLDANIRGTLNLLEEAKSQGVKHFIFAGSCAVYGYSRSRTVNEETACEPETWEGDPGPAYGIMKLATERLCLMYCYHHGLPVTAFRIEFVYNDNDALSGSRIVEDLQKKQTIEVVKGDGYAGIHVDEVIQAFLLATLSKKAYGQVFNLANHSTYVTYEELYELLIQHMHLKSKVRAIADSTHKGRVVESAEKITRVLGWKPMKTKKDFIQAIIRSVGSQRNKQR
jgi:nucleoside-diphosphate-sugar epimerase